MDTSLNLAAPTATTTSAPVLARSVTTKVQAIEPTDDTATLPSQKPFVAQVVNAQLAGSEIPEKPSEIAPAERTLHPYDVPMLPYTAQREQPDQTDAETIGADTLQRPSDDP